MHLLALAMYVVFRMVNYVATVKAEYKNDSKIHKI